MGRNKANGSHRAGPVVTGFCFCFVLTDFFVWFKESIYPQVNFIKK